MGLKLCLQDTYRYFHECHTVCINRSGIIYLQNTAVVRGGFLISRIMATDTAYQSKFNICFSTVLFSWREELPEGKCRFLRRVAVHLHSSIHNLSFFSPASYLHTHPAVIYIQKICVVFRVSTPTKHFHGIFIIPYFVGWQSTCVHYKVYKGHASKCITIWYHYYFCEFYGK